MCGEALDIETRQELLTQGKLKIDKFKKIMDKRTDDIILKQKKFIRFLEILEESPSFQKFGYKMDKKTRQKFIEFKKEFG